MVLRSTLLICVLIIFSGYFFPPLEAMNSPHVASASPDQQLTSYTFFKSSPVQLFSFKNLSIASASLLSCVVRGTADDTCVAVNFSVQSGICQLIYSDGITARLGQPTGENSRHWRSIEIREVQNVSVQYIYPVERFYFSRSEFVIDLFIYFFI